MQPARFANDSRTRRRHRAPIAQQPEGYRAAAVVASAATAAVSRGTAGWAEQPQANVAGGEAAGSGGEGEGGGGEGAEAEEGGNEGDYGLEGRLAREARHGVAAEERAGGRGEVAPLCL